VVAVTLALAVVVGITLGLLGGGGSILTVPLLVYVAGMDPKEAIATSLVVVGVTSAVGVIAHARGGRVQWRTGVIFGAAGMAGAYAGGRLGGYLSGDLLLALFALMMVATSAAMLRGRKGPARPPDHRPKAARIVLDGVVVGLVTGLVGAGGGFLVVPALALLGGLPMPVAIGTSLVVIAMKSFAGAAGYLATVELDWALTGGVTAAAVVGSIIGGRLAGRVPADALRVAFGWFVLGMGGFVLLQQVPDPGRVPALIGFAVVVVGAGLCAFLRPDCPLRKLGRTRTSEPAAEVSEEAPGVPQGVSGQEPSRAGGGPRHS
jgi:uncharacterized protein